MSEDKTDSNKPARKPLGLKRSVDAGEVKQTFSHGRTNKVVVEVKRRKLVGKPGAPEAAKPVVAEARAPAAAPVAPARPVPPPKVPMPSQMSRKELQDKLLREAEESRLNAMEEARKREAEAARAQSEAEKQRLAEKREAEARAVQQSEQEVPAAAATPSETPPAAPASEGADAAVPMVQTSANLPPARKFTPVESPKRPKVEAVSAEAKKPEVKKPGRNERSDRAEKTDRRDRRQSGKLTVNRALAGDDAARARSLAALKRAREKERRSQMGGGMREQREKQVREVVVPEAITVQELANRMAEKGADLVKSLFNMGSMVTVNQTIDQDTAELLVEEFGHKIKRVSDADVEINSVEDIDPEETLRPRPPVVTIMGHVDHGKTSLLDALRGTDVVAGEAGGITQHIGAYQVTTKSGQVVTFLDTPGHEAFTEMRARGANVTDIVILVVAADDGLMPQTIEAINHTKAAGVPMIVAINKVDKDGANPQKIRERLLEHEVIVESLSGEVQDVEVSALKKTGLDDLIDNISLQAEILDLKARPDRDAVAVVVEAQLDKGRGPVATVLIERGTLKRGDVFVVGSQTGKVRALIDDKGKQVKEAGPSQPVEVLGLSGVPSAGDKLTVVENEARAREIASYRQEQDKLRRTTVAPANLENLFSAKEDKIIEYPVLVKADVQGSSEAIVNALNKLATDDIRVRVLHSGVGGITESDVSLASASKAPIIGFNVRANANARDIAKRDGVRFKYFDVIYDLIDDIRGEMAGELGPERIETVVGRAEIKEIFPAGKKDKAAGLLVLEGIIRKGLHARLTREDVIVSATTIASLRRFKDNVEEVRSGLECGVMLQDTNDIKPGDTLEVFAVEMKERTL